MGNSLIKSKKAFVIILMAALVLLGIYFFRNKENPYQFENNTLHYSQDRGRVEYKIRFNHTEGNVDISEINFRSRPFLEYETRIYGLLFAPKNQENIPGIVFLPAGAAVKEQRAELARLLAENGYAVLVIDQRGVGQTGGNYLSFQDDYALFSKGYEPIQHLVIYDALRSYDVLSNIKAVDKNNIAIAGESMGGRYAIIAAAIEKRLRGAVVISGAGFHIRPDNTPGNNYLISIDPDHYIGKISPNHLIMLHGSEDDLVPLNDVQVTYEKALEPKELFIAEGCAHGYCKEMEESLLSSLEALFL